MITSEITTDPLYVMAGEIHDALRDHGHDESAIYSIMHFGTIISDLRMRDEVRQAEDARTEQETKRYIAELSKAAVR